MEALEVLEKPISSWAIGYSGRGKCLGSRQSSQTLDAQASRAVEEIRENVGLF